MKTFKVFVRLEDGTHHHYDELAMHSADCVGNAAVKYGPCKVNVVRA